MLWAVGLMLLGAVAGAVGVFFMPRDVWKVLVRVLRASNVAGPGDDDGLEAEAGRQDGDSVESATSARLALPAEAAGGPAALLEARWSLPSGVARAVAAFVELIMRDFVMSWYRVRADGTVGVSEDPQFLEYLQFVITNALGNLAFRSTNIHPILFLVEDVGDVVRRHLALT